MTIKNQILIANIVENFNQYDTIYIGFPNWGGKAPNIINTFLESYDLTNKKIIPFGTYHSSGVGETDIYLKPSCEKTNYVNAVAFQMGDLDVIDLWL